MTETASKQELPMVQDGAGMTGGLVCVPVVSLAADGLCAKEPASLICPSRSLKSSLRVLLVEDQMGDAHLVMLALRESLSPTFRIIHAQTFAAAAKAVEDDPAFDVILLDLSLPDLSGLQTITNMQSVAPQIPIVIMTGLDDPAFAETALEAGAQDYLVKSDDPSTTVVRAIRYAITRMNSQIERDALAARVAEQQKILLKELAAARVMQFDLLPKPEKVGPRLCQLGIEVEAAFEPSSGIGGDLWGCLDCGDGRMAFYTFDFSGHGIAAALNVFRLHALIADRWTSGQGPADIISMLGRTLPGLVGRGQYATMFFGVIDTARHELRWSAAGAPQPFLIHQDGVEFLDTKGIPLGLTRSASYVEHCIPFPAGTSLFLYSDALTEASLPDGDMLGEERLAEIIRHMPDFTIAGLLERCFREITLPLSDDLTALRITSRADQQ